MKTYRIGIIGCCSRGTAAARAYHAHPRAEVVGLCDLVPAYANTLGEELKISARFTDLDEMIREVQPDIVVIATGTEFHYDLCMRALNHGVHIDVEKPMCVDLVQADAVIAKAQTQGMRIAVHHQGRVGASMRAIDRAVQEGRIGDIRYIYGSGKGYYGGYGLMNIGTHMLTNIIKLGGPCRRVVAIGLTDGRPITPSDVLTAPGGMGTVAGERITAALQFEKGVTATLLEHRMQPADSTAYAMEIYGTEGRLFWKNSGAWWLSRPHFVPDEEHNRWQALPLILPEHFDPLKGAGQDDYWYVEEYVRALDEGRDHECSGSAARHVIEIMMGIFESAAYGGCVELPQKRRDHPLLRWLAEMGLPAPEDRPRSYEEWLAVEDRRLSKTS